MEKSAANYTVSTCDEVNSTGRLTLNARLSLTGSEISINELPAGIGVDFVHSHKQNEEVYIILAGEGYMFIDGDEFPVREGSVIRVAPEGQRCITAGKDSSLRFICIQTQSNSLQQFTMDDGMLNDVTPSWLK